MKKFIPILLLIASCTAVPKDNAAPVARRNYPQTHQRKNPNRNANPTYQSQTQTETNTTTDTSAPIVSSLTGSNVAGTKFGIMVNTNAGIQVGKDLGIKYQRARVIFTQYTGSCAPFEQFTNAGFAVLLNINYTDLNNEPFVTDTTSYKKLLDGFLSKYHPEVAVIENEEQNGKYHSGPITDYINELAAATRVAHAHNVKVTNGGIETKIIMYLVYEDYVNHGLKQNAASFASRTSLQVPATPTMQAKIRDAQTLIQAYKNIPLDYINFHYYGVERITGSKTSDADAPGIIQEIAEYLTRATGKPVMSNEMGQLNSSPAYVTSVLQNAKDAGLKYVIWYDADGTSAVGLNDPNGTLRPNGEAFKNYIATKGN